MKQLACKNGGYVEWKGQETIFSAIQNLLKKIDSGKPVSKGTKIGDEVHIVWLGFPKLVRPSIDKDHDRKLLVCFPGLVRAPHIGLQAILTSVGLCRVSSYLHTGWTPHRRFHCAAWILPMKILWWLESLCSCKRNSKKLIHVNTTGTGGQRSSDNWSSTRFRPGFGTCQWKKHQKKACHAARASHPPKWLVLQRRKLSQAAGITDGLCKFSWAWWKSKRTWTSKQSTANTSRSMQKLLVCHPQQFIMIQLLLRRGHQRTCPWLLLFLFSHQDTIGCSKQPVLGGNIHRKLRAKSHKKGGLIKTSPVIPNVTRCATPNACYSTWQPPLSSGSVLTLTHRHTHTHLRSHERRSLFMNAKSDYLMVDWRHHSAIPS